MKSNYKSYESIRASESVLVWRQSEIPVEYSISLPLPIIYENLPGYIYFAAPASRLVSPTSTDILVTIGPVDRWWVVSSIDGLLLFYKRLEVQPNLPIIQLSKEEDNQLVELVKKMNEFEMIIDGIATDYFNQTSLHDKDRLVLWNILQSLIPAPLLPRYQEYASGFISWLNQ
jgi:hypothetical protein